MLWKVNFTSFSNGGHKIAIWSSSVPVYSLFPFQYPSMQNCKPSLTCSNFLVGARYSRLPSSVSRNLKKMLVSCYCSGKSYITLFIHDYDKGTLVNAPWICIWIRNFWPVVVVDEKGNVGYPTSVCCIWL